MLRGEKLIFFDNHGTEEKEEELLRLQGDTTELRRRELEALDPSNRALKENIWRIEDAAEATQKLSEAMGRFKEEDFATLLDFNRARGALAGKMPQGPQEFQTRRRR
jgi:hypothetical protein